MTALSRARSGDKGAPQHRELASTSTLARQPDRRRTSPRVARLRPGRGAPFGGRAPGNSSCCGTSNRGPDRFGNLSRRLSGGQGSSNPVHASRVSGSWDVVEGSSSSGATPSLSPLDALRQYALQAPRVGHDHIRGNQPSNGPRDVTYRIARSRVPRYASRQALARSRAAVASSSRRSSMPPSSSRSWATRSRWRWAR